MFISKEGDSDSLWRLLMNVLALFWVFGHLHSSAGLPVCVKHCLYHVALTGMLRWPVSRQPLGHFGLHVRGDQ